MEHQLPERVLKVLFLKDELEYPDTYIRREIADDQGWVSAGRIPVKEQACTK